MKRIFMNTLFPLVLAFVSYAMAGQEFVWDFEEVPVKEIPTGWKVEATNLRGKLATWEVVSDFDNRKKTNVLGMTEANNAFGGTFNIIWTDSVRFKDVEIEVRFKAIKGIEDQGGGLMWRVQDKNNYYIARANPLENNFRVYYVKNGERKTLDSARVKIPLKKWHTIKIVHNEDHIEGFLNGKKYLDSQNSTFKKDGGVGLWTKADAVTNFDDLKVKQYQK